MSVQTVNSVYSPGEDPTIKLPDIVAVWMPSTLFCNAQLDMQSHNKWPVRTITCGCVAVPALTPDNFLAAMTEADLRARPWVDKVYIATADICDDAAFFRELRHVAKAMKIGLILIDPDHPENTFEICPPIWTDVDYLADSLAW